MNPPWNPTKNGQWTPTNNTSNKTCWEVLKHTATQQNLNPVIHKKAKSAVFLMPNIQDWRRCDGVEESVSAVTVNKLKDWPVLSAIE